ncbi:ribonuclease E/G [uncultured Clostridium sp.]|uniref:ribonuclease E/G n=1 Tax=uncultured Clostridium sp. TaxID=59620 RepID=UPI002636C6B7|nr:ribonuclease E/G [uncultured Clostridium sp.]
MREICIERSEKFLRVAVRDNGILEECFIEEKTEEPTVGEIYKAKIKNIVPGINSIFLDMGLSKEGYMYYSDELKKLNVKKGDELLVEVLKEPLGDKGAKVTHKVSIPGKYIVLSKGNDGIVFSKRINDDVKKQLILAELKKIDGVTLTIRTEGAKAPLEALENESNRLKDIYDELLRKLNYSNTCERVFGKKAALSKVIIDNITKEDLKIYVNNENDEEFIKKFLDKENVIIERYEGLRTLFDYLDIEKEILKLRHNKIALPCGGNIVIERTEAMYVIDINSGKNIKEKNLQKTVLETNVEAAREIGKQIMLRNLSGIIVIDFIDLRDKNDRFTVMRELKKSLSKDGGNSKIFPFTELDLIQISRRRRGKSIYDSIEEKCTLCQGTGNVLRLAYVETLIKNEILKSLEENTIKSFYIELDSTYKERVSGDIITFLKNIDGIDKEIYLNYVDGISGYKVEPIIFLNQRENLKNYLIKAVEKC